jgi:NAD-dependent DNA ligase
VDPRRLPGAFDDALACSLAYQSFAGCVIVFTGKAERTRADLTHLAEAAGAKVENRVNAWTTYVVAADPNGSSAKLSKARAYETEVIEVDSFYQMVIHGR